MTDLHLDRRDLLLGSLAAAFATAGLNEAEAAGVDPAQTIIALKDHIPWQIHYGYPTHVAEEAALFSNIDKPGQYFVLVKWYPGHMSAPHWYETDRLSFVVSGTWYVASGKDFVPEKTVPVPAGSFVRRVAKTVHYDGVIASAKEPAIIAISGIGPIKAHRIEPDKPGWRKV